MVMVITKMDLFYKATVDPSEAEKLAKSLGWHLVKLMLIRLISMVRK